MAQDKFIHQPGKGDTLAAGGAKATFHMGGEKTVKVDDKRTDYSPEALAAKAADEKAAVEAAFAKREEERAQRRERIKQEFADAMGLAAKIHPVGDKVAVWIVPEEDTLLYDPDPSNRRANVAVVISVSDRPSDEYAAAALEAIHAGDTVTILSQTGTEVQVEGVSLVVLHVFDLLLRL